jgi:hypothetical protein
MRAGRVSVTVTAIALAALATACASSKDDTDTASAAAGPSGVPVAASTATTSATPLRTPGASSAPGSGTAPTCLAAGLSGALADSEGAAGHVYANLVLTNTGPAACRLTGVPAVVYVDGSGATLGAPADQDRGKGTTEASVVTLAPGGTAKAQLRITQPGLLPGCDVAGQARPAANLRVTPPGDGGTVLVRMPQGVTACSAADVHQLTIGALTP